MPTLCPCCCMWLILTQLHTNPPLEYAGIPVKVTSYSINVEVRCAVTTQIQKQGLKHPVCHTHTHIFSSHGQNLDKNHSTILTASCDDILFPVSAKSTLIKCSEPLSLEDSPLLPDKTASLRHVHNHYFPPTMPSYSNNMKVDQLYTLVYNVIIIILQSHYFTN